MPAFFILIIGFFPIFFLTYFFLYYLVPARAGIQLFLPAHAVAQANRHRHHHCTVRELSTAGIVLILYGKVQSVIPEGHIGIEGEALVDTLSDAAVYTGAITKAAIRSSIGNGRAKEIGAPAIGYIPAAGHAQG